uniref:C3H1-type domain-containing protein n=1 Tax=Chromera velia CCMP2878 TaxID=1169474 RepID=A0A0G4IB90_9ALVE
MSNQMSPVPPPPPPPLGVPAPPPPALTPPPALPYPTADSPVQSQAGGSPSSTAPCTASAAGTPVPPGSSAAFPSVETRLLQGRQFFKTRMCEYWMQGRCVAGGMCKFAHDPAELRKAPDLQKTKLCATFMKGFQCRSSCPFAHGFSELRATPDFFRTKLCPRIIKHLPCNAGPACRFAHSLDELRPTPNESERQQQQQQGDSPQQQAQSPSQQAAMPPPMSLGVQQQQQHNTGNLSSPPPPPPPPLPPSSLSGGTPPPPPHLPPGSLSCLAHCTAADASSHQGMSRAWQHSGAAAGNYTGNASGGNGGNRFRLGGAETTRAGWSSGNGISFSLSQALAISECGSPLPPGDIPPPPTDRHAHGGQESRGMQGVPLNPALLRRSSSSGADAPGGVVSLPPDSDNSLENEHSHSSGETATACWQLSELSSSRQPDNEKSQMHSKSSHQAMQMQMRFQNDAPSPVPLDGWGPPPPPPPPPPAKCPPPMPPVQPKGLPTGMTGHPPCPHSRAAGAVPQPACVSSIHRMSTTEELEVSEIPRKHAKRQTPETAAESETEGEFFLPLPPETPSAGRTASVCGALSGGSTTDAHRVRASVSGSGCGPSSSSSLSASGAAGGCEGGREDDEALESLRRIVGAWSPGEPLSSSLW